MMDELMEILEELRPDVDFANETKLKAQQPRTRQLQLRKGYARAD